MTTLVFSGCFDVFTTTTKPVIGKISLNNLNQQGNDGYNLVLDGYGVLEGFVTDITGDDSVLLVRAIKGMECEEVYYIARHNKGDRPVKVSTLLKGQYDSLRTVSKYTISISELEYVCP